MTKDTAVQRRVQEFLDETRLPITELGRLARNPRNDKPMTTNTIRAVLEGGGSDESKQRLLDAIDSYAADVWEKFGKDSPARRRAAESLSGERTRRRR